MHLPACLLSSPLALCGCGVESASAALQARPGRKEGVRVGHAADSDAIKET